MAERNTEQDPKRKDVQDPRVIPTWRNTRPRGNPATDERDLARSVERFEAVLGR
jgi:hypothetical protein